MKTAALFLVMLLSSNALHAAKTKRAAKPKTAQTATAPSATPSAAIPTPTAATPAAVSTPTPAPVVTPAPSIDPAPVAPDRVAAFAQAPLYTGLYLVPTIALDLSEYSNVLVRGGFGFSGQVLAQYFFTSHLGVYSGFDIALRKMTLNSSSNPLFLDIPLGLAFQYSLSPSVVNLIGVGMYYSIPFSSFGDSAGPINLQGTFGVDILLSTYIPLTDKVDLGINGNFRVSLGSPFVPSTTASLLGVQLGISGRVRLF